MKNQRERKPKEMFRDLVRQADNLGTHTPPVKFLYEKIVAYTLENSIGKPLFEIEQEVRTLFHDVWDEPRATDDPETIRKRARLYEQALEINPDPRIRYRLGRTLVDLFDDFSDNCPYTRLSSRRTWFLNAPEMKKIRRIADSLQMGDQLDQPNGFRLDALVYEYTADNTHGEYTDELSLSVRTSKQVSADYHRAAKSWKRVTSCAADKRALFSYGACLYLAVLFSKHTKKQSKNMLEIAKKALQESLHKPWSHEIADGTEAQLLYWTHKYLGNVCTVQADLGLKKDQKYKYEALRWYTKAMSSMKKLGELNEDTVHRFGMAKEWLKQTYRKPNSQTLEPQ